MRVWKQSDRPASERANEQTTCESERGADPEEMHEVSGLMG